MYEQYFTGFARFAFYAQFPVRACVQILPERPDAPTGLHVWWEVVGDWAGTIPEVTEDPGLAPRSFVQMAYQMRADCDRLHRPFIEFTVSNGSSDWAPWEPAVTNEVRDMLSSDLRRIASWLASAS